MIGKGAVYFSNICKCCAGKERLKKEINSVKNNLAGLVVVEKGSNAWISIVCIAKAANPAGVDRSMQVHGNNFLQLDSGSI